MYLFVFFFDVHNIPCVSKIVALWSVCEYGQTWAYVDFTWLKPYFKVSALMCEGSSQTIVNLQNMPKITISIFLTMKFTFFETHSRPNFKNS